TASPLSRNPVGVKYSLQKIYSIYPGRFFREFAPAFLPVVPAPFRFRSPDRSQIDPHHLYPLRSVSSLRFALPHFCLLLPPFPLFDSGSLLLLPGIPYEHRAPPFQLQVFHNLILLSFLRSLPPDSSHV